MALKKRGLAGRIIGIGRSPERLQKAMELGAIDEWSTDMAVQDADLVYIATPVGLEIDFIRQVVPLAKSGCIITDAGSTKAQICRAADSLIKKDVSFIGGHPMAGSEATGVTAGNADLFEGAAYVLTPTERTDPEALEAMKGLAEGIGSKVIVMDPDAHDRCAAVISHLPHLIAASLVSLAHDRSMQDPQVFELIAGSFRDMTRVAGSSPALWRDICLSNPDAIKDAVTNFQELLGEGLSAMESRSPEAVEKWFAEGKRVRDSLSPRRKPDLRE